MPVIDTFCVDCSNVDCHIVGERHARPDREGAVCRRVAVNGKRHAAVYGVISSQGHIAVYLSCIALDDQTAISVDHYRIGDGFSISDRIVVLTALRLNDPVADRDIAATANRAAADTSTLIAASSSYRTAADCDIAAISTIAAAADTRVKMLASIKIPCISNKHIPFVHALHTAFPEEHHKIAFI